MQAFAVAGVPLLSCCLLGVEVNSLQPHSGTPHYQGFIQFKRKLGRKQALLQLPGHPHLEQRQGTAEQAAAYCTKEEGRLAGPWRFGALVFGPGGAPGLSAILSVVAGGGSLADAAAVDPAAYTRVYRGIAHYQELVAPPVPWRPVRAFFLEGQTGCGKSSLVYDNFPASDVYALAKQAPLWFNGYRGERVLFIDEYQGSIAREELLRILDGHRYAAEFKGGFSSARWDCVVLAANYEFALWRDPAVRRRFERGGYFRLSGRRGQYVLLEQLLRGERGVDGLLDACVERVPFDVPAPPLGQAWNYFPLRV